MKFVYPRSENPVLHPTDEDLSLHPSAQRSCAGDPESVGTPDLGHPSICGWDIMQKPQVLRLPFALLRVAQDDKLLIRSLRMTNVEKQVFQLRIG